MDGPQSSAERERDERRKRRERQDAERDAGRDAYDEQRSISHELYERERRLESERYEAERKAEKERERAERAEARDLVGRLEIEAQPDRVAIVAAFLNSGRRADSVCAGDRPASAAAVPPDPRR